jgi:uncharacterized protein
LDKIPVEIRKMLKKYFALLKQNNIKLNKAYLFGSYASGNYSTISDIDIALVSDAFEGVRINDREKIRKITLSVSSDLEVMPFNTKDFTNENPFAREIMETGISLPL